MRPARAPCRTQVCVLFYTEHLVERDSRKLIKLLEDDGWVRIGVTGSHHHFKHPIKPGKVTIPHPRKDLPTGTVRSLLRQAGLLER
jgi:predicted RNA binding protein YcfA (HicA-like mRNA interferase family)